ncbi:MAG: 50S ribosome-binding GTPase [Pirellulaceae bacterium]|nr:50S ribosome-binding GTPase [Pirellulaceae bacterium]
MPANLTQKYHKAEQDYRRACSPDDEFRCLQVMLRELPKHKGTDKLQADLKQRISKAKLDAEAAKSSKKGYGVRIPRQGAGRVILLGSPNSGKSQLLCSLTRATPEVATYPFTTRDPIPGMMPWDDIQIQLIDTPPITTDFLEPYLQGLIRGSDLALLVVDLASDDGIEQCQEVWDRLDGTKTRLASRSYLDVEDIGQSFTQCFLVGNKIDADGAPARLNFLSELLELGLKTFPVSAQTQVGLHELKQSIYRTLDIVRVYTKHPTKREPDFDNPYTIQRGGTLADVAAMIHHDFATRLKFARVWGSAVHHGTTVKGDYVLHDKDIIELHI